ncbi:MAG: single- stranded DNA-binding family protein [Candidatus Bathyarchaeota archaeon]
MVALNTGFVIVGGYAGKVRKTLFAQLRTQVKDGSIPAQNVAKAIAELNRILYILLVEKLKAERGDVVRVKVEYDVKNGEVIWNYNTLKLEVCRRFPDEEIEKIVKLEVPKILAFSAGEVKKPEVYVFKKISTTSLGDDVYRVLSNDADIGLILVSKIDDGILVKGVFLKPQPVVVEHKTLTVRGKTVDDVLNESVQEIVKAGKPVTPEEAGKVRKRLETLIES